MCPHTCHPCLRTYTPPTRWHEPSTEREGAPEKPFYFCGSNSFTSAFASILADLNSRIVSYSPA